MEDVTLVRRTLVDRLDGVAQLLEAVAAEAVRDGELPFATDLWVTSAQILAIADELWTGVGSPSGPGGATDPA